MAKKPGDPGYDPAVDGVDNSSALTSSMNTGSLYSGVPVGGELDTSAQKVVKDQLTGDAYRPYETAAQEAMARSAQNIRAQTGGSFAPNVGQGSAVRAQQGAEETILKNQTDTALGIAQGKEATKTAGLSAYSNLANLDINRRAENLSEKSTLGNLAINERAQTLSETQANKSNLQTEYTNAVNAGSFDVAANIYKQMTGETLDISQMKTTQDYTNALNSASVKSATLTNQKTEASLGIDKYNAIANMVNTGAMFDQINAQYPGAITPDQYVSMKAASQTSLQQQTIDISRNTAEGNLAIAKSQLKLNGDTLEEQKAEWADKRTSMNAADQREGDALYGYDKNGKHIAGSLEIQNKASDIQAQGMSLQEAQLKGYTDEATGKHVLGSLEAAQEDLGLKSTTVKAQTDEAYANIANMTADQQNKVKELYGYTNSATGQHVAGSMELNQTQVTAAAETARMSVLNQIAQTQGTLSIQDRVAKTQEASAESTAYWDASKKFATYAQAHLDAKATDPQVVAEAAKWYEAEFGTKPDTSSSQFQQFAASELKAAQDGRLTNPIDESLYQIDSATGLSDSEKAQFKAVVKSLPPNTKFTEDKDGNVEVDTGSAFGADLTFDETNTRASSPSMFAQAGGVWTGDGQQTFLSDGQKITLGSNFGIETTSRTIPKGNYTVLQVADGKNVLISEDGKKAYYTAAAGNGDSNTGSLNDLMMKKGWKQDGLTGVFTKS